MTDPRSTKMLTLDGFVLARAEEQEAQERALGGTSAPTGGSHVLATCRAHRAVVALYRTVTASGTPPHLLPAHQAGMRTALEATLRHLAAVHAEHEDYRQEWRP